MTNQDGANGRTESLTGRVATRVRSLMAAKRKTTKELAQLLHLSTRVAGRRKNGEQAFTLDELEQVAAWLDVPAVALITGVDVADRAVA